MIERYEGVKVLVTGAAGFIGPHLVGRLVELGAEVYAADLPAANTSRLPKQARLVLGDLSDPASVRDLMAQVRPVKVFHLAAHSNVARSLAMIDDSLEDLKTTLNLLRVLPDSACDCFVLTGTCEEYGDNPAPFREDQPFNPVSPYSASKSAAVLYGRMLHKTMGLPIVVIRPLLSYGPGQNTRMFLPSAILAALREEEYPMTGGEQTREFNYVTDTVDGFVRAAVTPAALGEIINVGNGHEYPLRHVVERISALAGKPLKAKFGVLPYRPGETWHFYCDNSKARRLLGWVPRVDLDDGLKRTIEWYRSEHRIA